MLEPDQLLDQAERLLAPPPGLESNGLRWAHLADCCRALSTAYYAVFHAGLRAAADLVVGEAERDTPLYGLAYRSIDHAKMKGFCREVLKSAPSAKYQRYVPIAGWDQPLRDYARAFIVLNEKRMLADYDPAYIVAAAEVDASIRLARSAIDQLDDADHAAKRAFLMLLLFPPR